MLLLDPTIQPEVFHVSRADRTRTELLANRRRFQREGVSLVAGDRNALFFLPIQTRRSIAVRPAVRLCEDRPSGAEEAVRVAFPWAGRCVIAALLCLLATLVVVQGYFHFHPIVAR